MLSWVVLVISLVAIDADAGGPRLGGAFIQFDGCNREWTPRTWEVELAKMKAAKLDVVIVQYMEARADDDPPTSEEYVPEAKGDPDPLTTILDYADRHGMKVFVGLRYDARLLKSELLNEPGKLKKALADELGRNSGLAGRLTKRYRLKARKSFEGWYLPVEVANFEEKRAGQADGWVAQAQRLHAEAGQSMS